MTKMDDYDATRVGQPVSRQTVQFHVVDLKPCASLFWVSLLFLSSVFWGETIAIFFALAAISCIKIIIDSMDTIMKSLYGDTRDN